MTLRELENRLHAAGIENYRGEAKILAESFSEDALDGAASRRISGEPLQYIIGKWYFMNEVYEVSPAVLIPRQDTECLVEWAIKNIPHGARIADLCTGSGCIAVSTLAARRDLTCVAVEKYPDALDVAKRNASLNGVSDRIEFVEADVLKEQIAGEFDAILSNPPYVTAEEYKALDKELYFEPPHSLTDGADGLTFYRTIFEKYPAHMKRGGVIALEIGANQAKDVETISASRGFSAQIIKDYSGNDRVAVCKIIRS